MRYGFDCYTHGEFVIEAPIREGPPDIVYCPECNEESVRKYESVPDIWNTQGAHKTDYDKTGDKLEKLNKSWSKKYGEEPPPMAKDIPKNSSEPV